MVQAQLFPWAEVEALQLLSQLFALGVREPASRLLGASHAGLVSKLPAQSPVAQEPSSRMVGPGLPQRSSRLLRPEEQELASRLLASPLLEYFVRFLPRLGGPYWNDDLGRARHRCRRSFLSSGCSFALSGEN